MKIKSDELLCPELKRKVQELRGAINKGKDLVRFTKTPCDDFPGYIITDTETGRQTTVPLYALSNVMDVLDALFT